MSKTFIGQSTCGWTVRQLEVFQQENVGNDDFTMCLVDKSMTMPNGTTIRTCTPSEAQVATAFPYWIVDGSHQPGFKNNNEVRNLMD